MQALVQGVGAVGGHKEGLVPRAVALLHHLVQTSQYKGSLTVTQSGESHNAHDLAGFRNQPMHCTAMVSCNGMRPGVVQHCSAMHAYSSMLKSICN